MVIKLNIVRLNCASLNHASLNGVGERLRASAGGGGGEVIPPDIPVTYTLNASVENGSVKATVNGVAVTLPYTANEGEVVVVEVTANNGYEFEGWSDGNKSNPRTIIVNEDITLNASCKEVFVPLPTYTLSASVVNGVISATLNGKAISLPYEANEGDVIVVSVEPNEGFSFEGWNDGNTDNPRTITMTADVVLSAQCVEVVVPPAKEYIQFEDAEVERVLMSKGVSSDGVGITMEDAAKVTSIETWFANNKNITSFDEFVYFTGVTELVHNAFLDSSLVSISLPKSLKIIKGAAFARCYNLVGDFIIPQAEELNQAAFMSTAITSVYAPNVVELTGDNAEGVFRKCQALKKATLGKVANIPRECFADCSNLTEVEIEWDNVKEIAQDAFIRCTSLPRFDIGGNVTSIGGGAFYYCSSLQLLICRATTPPSLAHTNAFTNTNNCPIYVPDASLEAYKGATNWNSYADRIHPLSEIEGSLVFYDKLVGDGTAYINTEYYPTSWDNVEWDADAPSVYNKCIFGCKSSVLSVANLVYSATQSYYNYKPSTSATSINEDNAKRQRRTLRIVDLGNGSYRREVADLDSGVVNSIDAGWSGKDVVATNALRVFCSTTSAGANEKFYKGAIRSFVITDAKTGNTIMSLKPCTFAGEAGMWDEVNGKFYGNAAASGEFSVANDE